MDKLKLTAEIQNPKILLDDPLFGFTQKKKTATGDVIPGFYNRKEFGGLHLTLHGKHLTITNSLARYWHGNNYEDFPFGDVCNALLTLCDAFKVKPDCMRLTGSMEMPFNIETPYPALEYLPLFRSGLTSRPFVPMPPRSGYTGQIYGMVCENSFERLKGYDKAEDVWQTDRIRIDKNWLRIESGYPRRDKIFPQIKTAADIMKPENYNEIGKRTLEKIEGIQFKPDTNFVQFVQGIKPAKLKDLLFYQSAESITYLSILKKTNPDAYKKHSRNLRRLQEEFPEAYEVREMLVRQARQKWEALKP